jgi:hypothetical protein
VRQRGRQESGARREGENTLRSCALLSPGYRFPES